MQRSLIAVVLAAALVTGADAQTYTPGTYYPGQDVNSAPTQNGAQNIIPTSCSGTITVGGTPQVAIPYQARRHGYIIQNQSSGPLYLRSVSGTGTLQATQDQSSLRIDAGFLYQPNHVTDFAYSIVGATTGQAFHCQYW